MNRWFRLITTVHTSPLVFHGSMLVFRVLVSLELFYVHGLKKVGVGVAQAEQVPNPLGLPEMLNQLFATAANLFCPLLIVIGLFTRLAAVPVLLVTATGYFIVHWNDTPIGRDIPFMYSVSFLLVVLLGPGKYSVDHWLSRRG